MMPVLDFGLLLEPGGLYRARIAFQGVMAWPKLNDEPSRKEYVATLMSLRLAGISEMREKLPDPVAAKGWEETIYAIGQHESAQITFDEFQTAFDEAGGYAAVSMAPGSRTFLNHFNERIGDWFAAGLILTLVQRMAANHPDLRGGASVNKAIFILEKVGIPLVPRNSLYLRRAWETYKPVAHFCAVLFEWFMISYEDGENPTEIAAIMERELDENFMMFLSQAEAYLEFGLTFQPLHSKKASVLDPEETWVFPKYRPWPESHLKGGPLTGALLEAAQQYRAPIPSG